MKCKLIEGGLLIYPTASNQVTVSPCCMVIKSTQQTISPSTDFSLLFPKLRETGVDPITCRKCIRSERVLGESVRTQTELRCPSELPGIRTIEVSLDFICNLACMICSPAVSSLWHRYEKANKSVTNLTQVLSFLTQQDLSNVTNVKVLGGEPFLSPNNVLLLKLLIEKADPSTISIMYNTNGTVVPSPEVVRLLQEFKTVEIVFSVDDIDAAEEWQRFPVKWNTQQSTMLKIYKTLPDSTLYRIERTISLLNLHRLPLLDAWFSETFPQENKQTDQSFLTNHYANGRFSLARISIKHFNWITQQYPEALPFVNQSIIETDSDMLSFIAEQDEKRNTSINLWFPEFVTFYS